MTNWEIIPLDESRIDDMKHLHDICFNDVYGDSFYNLIAKNHALKGALLYHDQKPVGEVVYQFEMYNGELVSYIVSISVLPEFRSQHYIFDQSKFVDRIYLHVKVSNEVAIKMYNKYGFRIVKQEEGTYEDESSYLMLRNNPDKVETQINPEMAEWVKDVFKMLD